jgi:DNA polymerase
MNPEQLRQYLEYFADLGIEDIVRREPVAGMTVKPIVTVEPAIVTPSVVAVSSVAPPRKQQPEIPLPKLAPENDSLAQIRADIGSDCRRCRLSHGRKQIVFGSGNEQAKLVFVGEGPGADEDEQGLPFVGRAGQLLTQMIDNTAAKDKLPLRREDVYICNVVKCRPPDNRTPQPDEMEICGQFLYRQLMVLKPKAICALGATAAKALLNTKEGVTKMRGNWQRWNGIPLMVTYHPSYLLRAYNAEAKKEAWLDLRKLFHFVLDDSRTDPE